MRDTLIASIRREGREPFMRELIIERLANVHQDEYFVHLHSALKG